MNTKDIINHVKTDHKILASYISDAINMGRNVILVYLTGKKPFKQPNWLGSSLRDYNAQRDKDKILNEFNNNPGLYGYGLVAGLQPAGYHILCIDIDIDNDCKELARKRYEEFFQKYGISYHLETTISGRYHIFFAVDKVSSELKKKLIELVGLDSDCEAKKYVYSKEVDGQIEILGIDGRHTVTVYNGIINNEKPVLVIPLNVSSLEYIQQSLSKFKDEINGITQGEIDDDVINKLKMTFRLMRKYNFIDGWKIDSIVSGFCVKNQIPDDKIFEIFKVIFGDEYDEQRTEYIIKLTKKKIDGLIPGTGSVVRETKQFLRSGLLSDEETKQVKDFIETIERSRRDKDDLELPDYLTDVEEIYLLSSRKKRSPRKGVYYKEKYFIERNIRNVKLVWYVELEADEPFAIYKKHEVTNDPEAIGVKIDIIKRIKEKKRVYQVRINDEHDYIPSTDFESPEQVAREIASEASDYLMSFNLSLFAKYIDIKMRLFWDKHGGVPAPCEISKVTGWSKDFKMFYHYDLNDDKHELHKDHTLYTEYKAESFNQQEQHKLVFELLKEGKYLGFLLDVSASSILLKPLNLQPFTTIVTGNPGTGKTTACLFATSLFYKSDEILLTSEATRTGLELKLVSLNSLPFLVDEAALAEDSAEVLKRIIFGVASKKGKTRGKKNLTAETKDIISNVFWTSETSDVDDIKRGGAYRRFIHLVVKVWQDFTERFDINNMPQPPNELYAGCGVDYIKYAIENLDKIRKRFNKETMYFPAKYKEITGIAKTCYAGIIFLEEFYKYYYNLEETFRFTELRKEVDKILEETLKTFTAVKEDVVFALQQYLFENDIRFIQYKKEENANRYIVVHRPHSEKLGEYDITERTYYVTSKTFKIIAKELEKEATLLKNELVKAGVMEKQGSTYVSKANQSRVWAFKIKFPDNPIQPPEQSEPPQQPPQEPPPTEPPPQPSPLELPPPTEPPPSPEPIKPEQSFDEIDDNIVDFFSRATYEQKPQKPKIEDKEKEKAPQQPQEKKKTPKAKKAKEATQAQPQPEEKAQDDQLIRIEGNKIIVDEDKLDIYDVKPREEIPKIAIEKKDLVPFSDLIVGCVDIETSGLETTDEILAICFNVYKGDELLSNRIFYLDECNNDEAELVSKFLNALLEADIDVLTGYNICTFDLPRIRAKDLSNRLRFTEPVNIAGAFIKNQIQQGYKIIVDNIEIDVIDSFHLVLKYDAIARTIPGQDYKLKSVARFFGISKEDRVILTHQQIRECYKSDRKRFNDYLNEDVREAYEIFRKLAPPYYYIRSIIPFSISFFDACRLSSAAVWERILEYYYSKDYTQTLSADEKKDFDGGLVIANPGIYKNVYKVDVTSLYPNIMLNYGLCSYKDKDKIALAILNEYTNLRIQLKAKAKAGDKEADLIQNSLKLLINSLFGFFGTGGFTFNDMRTSAMITAYGRRILKEMIAYIESNNGVIVECDTDGIFYSSKNGEEIYEGLRKKLSEINLNVELEFKDSIMYVSDKKNYIIVEPNGKITKKGSKYAGRDKSKLWTEFPVEYIKKFIKDPTEAETYKQEMYELIKNGKAFDWLKVTKRIGKNETRIILDGLKKGLILEPGSIVTCAYLNFRNGRFTFDSEEEKVYDVDYYLKEFQKIINEINSVIHRKQNDG